MEGNKFVVGELIA